MKVKLFICICLIFLLIFLIHFKTADHDIYYLNLSIDKNSYSYENNIKDYLESKCKLEKFISDFTSSDDRVTDLILAIEENKNIIMHNKRQTIKNALIKADLVTVFIGLNEINYKIGYSTINELYDYGDSFLQDVERLLVLLREYCKEDIALIGYYNPHGSYYNDYFNYINEGAKKLTDQYNVAFIDVSDIYKVNTHLNSIWMTEEEHELLSIRIKEFIDTKILK